MGENPGADAGGGGWKESGVDAEWDAGAGRQPEGQAPGIGGADAHVEGGCGRASVGGVFPGLDDEFTKEVVGRANCERAAGGVSTGEGVNLMFVQSPAVRDSFNRFGYPQSVIPAIGLLEFLCAALYLVPRTSVVGAILLTGYLGGAIATHVRMSDTTFVAPVA